MKRIILFLTAALFLLTLASAGFGAEENVSGKIKSSKEKIQVLANKLEGNYNSLQVTFVGNVVCKQGERVMVSDSLKITYKNSSNEANATKELEKMEAFGNVCFFYGAKTATGDAAVYFADEQKIVLTGAPTMWDGKNCIRGTKITFYVDSEEGTVEGNSTTRVSAIIYPEDDTMPSKTSKRKW